MALGRCIANKHDANRVNQMFLNALSTDAVVRVACSQ